MRVVFMGTPAFSVPALREIARNGHEVVAVYTRAPKPAGRRGLDLTKSAVHQAAEDLGIAVKTPRSLRDESAVEVFRSHRADVAVVIAYGLILPKPVLDAPRLGCLNVHASLLPRWRGAAPIQRAIMAGDAETGVMVMRMEEGLDTGPVGMTARRAVGPDETAGDLHDALSEDGARLIGAALERLAAGSLIFTPQPETGVTYAHKIDKAESRIDWASPALQVHNVIRGLSPMPGAWTEADFGRGPERMKVLRCALAEGAGAPGTVLDDALTIACSNGAIRLTQVQRAGKPVTGAAEFLRGTRMPAGSRFF